MANAQWKEWPESCNDCGHGLEVLTEDPRPGWGFDGDLVRCTNCSAVGHLSCSAEDDIYAWFPDD